MSFLQPLMLLGLIGAAIPIIIHLIHRRRPRRQAFAAIEFVIRSVQRVEKRWRLKRFLLLASRVLLLAALAFAAARPILGRLAAAAARRSGPERLAIIVDCSLSMRARHDGRTAFARATTQAKNLVEAMGPEDLAVVVAARARPELLLPRPTGARADLLRAIDGLEPTFEYADLASAVEVGLEAAGPSSSGTDGSAADKELPPVHAVVLSDLAGHGVRSAADLGAAKGAAVTVDLLDVLDGVAPANRVNQGITSLTIANVPGVAPRTVEARVRIRGFASETSDDKSVPGDITLRGPTGDLYAGSVELVPGTVVDKTLRYAFETPGYFAVSVALEADTLAEDDVRYAMADVRREVRTLIVDGAPSGVPKDDEIFYLEHALAAGARDQPPPKVITGDDLSRADLPSFDVVILAGVTSIAAGDGARLTDFVERGGGLLITATEGLDVQQYNASLQALLPRPLRGLKIADAEGAAGSGGAVGIGTLDGTHPVLNVFQGDAEGGLRSTRTRGYLLLQPARDRVTSVLATWEGGAPALIERGVGRGRVLLLTTSIDRSLSDLAIRPAFLPLVRRLLLHLGGALSAPKDTNTLVAQTRTIALPKGALGLSVAVPDGDPVRLTRASADSEGRISFKTTARPGHYAVSAAFAGGVERASDLDFTVNVDPRESDLRPLTLEEATAVLLGSGQAEPETRSAVARIARESLANPERIAAWLLAIMFIAFLLESALTARQPTKR